MDSLLRIYDNLPADYWWWMLVMIVMLPAVPFAMRAHYHLRRWYWQRRASREGGILPEERYAAAPGSPPPPVEWRAAVAELLVYALWMAAPAIIIAYDLPEWLDLALGIALLLGTIAYSIWRKFNDPPASPQDGALPDAEVPIHAVSGFLAAMAVIGVLLLLAWVA